MALTEKGTQRIEIIVRKSIDGGQEGAKEKEAEEQSAEGGTQDQDQEKGKGTSSKKAKAWWRTQITHSLAVVKQVGQQWLSYEIAGMGYKQGDQALQQQTQRFVEQVSDVGNIATSVAMGMTYGSAGGPVGALLGGAVMGLQTGMSTHFKYATREREYNMKIFKENNAIEYKRARAQINLTTGRLR